VGRMASPVLQQNGFPGSPAFESDQQRYLLAASKKGYSAKQRAAEEARRPANARRQSLRRVQDSREQLRKTTRARGVSNATIESSTTSTTAGRSFTVANINNGIIYLRYVLADKFHCR
jgi:hypothetical protein